MKLLNEKQLVHKLTTEYQYFSDENHICIDPSVFVTLFVHKYGGGILDWKKWIDKDKLYMQNISGFTYIFPLTKKQNGPLN